MALYGFRCKTCGAYVEHIIPIAEYDPKEERRCEECNLDGSTCSGILERELAPNRSVILGRYSAANGYSD